MGNILRFPGRHLHILVVLLASVSAFLPRLTMAATGIFEEHGDCGALKLPGSAEFDPASNRYTVTGSGENMWTNRDAFQFVWKKAAGDISLSADVTWAGSGGQPHRKACLLIRQTLDADSAYVDVALHGDGLTSLQFRDLRGAATHEVQASISAPRRLRIVKRGGYIEMCLAQPGEPLRFSGAATRISFQEPFYIGLGVCAHDANAVEKAVFTNVELQSPPPAASGEKPAVVYSTLETVIASTDRRVVYVSDRRIEAPNWSSDGKSLVVNADGRLEQVPVAGGVPRVIDTGFATRCNNDHGLSPDGSTLAISDQSHEGPAAQHPSLIYILPARGGTPHQVTTSGPSYFHGWSPDGRTIAFCGERNHEFDIYTIPVAGGPETRLTDARGLDDGPEFSPDGRHIFFNSERTGSMQVWRMRPDGSEQEQITDDKANNWFPHPSPDGKKIVFLSYEPDVVGHPASKDVTLKLMSLSDRKVSVLAKPFGGQGTINAPCWSPDGARIAFVSYQQIP